jgi:hypothetical protein
MFDYAVSPEQVPRTVRPAEPSVVKLMITVTNNTGRDVACSKLVFTFTPGGKVENLVDAEHVNDISSYPAGGTPWEIFKAAGGKHTAIPDSTTGLADGESIAFIFENVVVNQVVGKASIAVAETTSGVYNTSISVLKQEPGLDILELTAIPVQITPGGDSEIAWRTGGASSVTLVTETGTHTVDRDGHLPVRPVETQVYTLTASAGGKSVTAQVTVTVAALRIHSFGAVPAQVAQDDHVAFSWQVAGATSCTLDPGGVDLRPPGGGGIDLPVPVSSPYTLTARGLGRTLSAIVPIQVMPAELTGLTASPQAVPPGGEAVLSWAARWATGFTLQPAGTAFGREVTTAAVTPQRTTTYTLTARGLDPRSRQVTVAVGAVIELLGFTTDPDRPKELTLAWRTQFGSATLATWTSGAPKPAPVDAEGSKTIGLSATDVTSILLRVTGGGVTAEATMLVAGQLVQPGAAVSSFLVGCGSGVNSERSVVAIAWQSSGGLLRGRVRDGFSTKDLSGAAGQADFALGGRVTGQPLWSGDVYVPPAQAGTAQADAAGVAAGAGLSWSVT